MTYEILEQLGLGANDIGTDQLKSTLSDVNIEGLAKQLNIGEPTLEDIIKSLIAPNRDQEMNLRHRSLNLMYYPLKI